MTAKKKMKNYCNAFIFNFIGKYSFLYSCLKDKYILTLIFLFGGFLENFEIKSLST